MAKGPDQKRKIHKNSLSNLKAGSPGKRMTSKDNFSKAFKEDIYKFWTTGIDSTAKPRTKGQKLIADAAENKPEQFLKTVTGLLPREVDPDAKKEPSASDFAKTLMELNQKVGNKRADVVDEDVIDIKEEPIKPFLTEGVLPVDLEDE